MPGKVNPTSAKGLTMVAIQVMGNKTQRCNRRQQGNFELQRFSSPCWPTNLCWRAAPWLCVACNGFRRFLHLRGLWATPPARDASLIQSLMWSRPDTGDRLRRACQIANHAHQNGLSLREVRPCLIARSAPSSSTTGAAQADG